MLQAVEGAAFHAVTDFVPSPVRRNHPWMLNASYHNVLDPSTLTLNYDSPELDAELQTVFKLWHDQYNVSGFLVSSAELEMYPDLRNLTHSLNAALNSDMWVYKSSITYTFNYCGLLYSLSR